MRTKKRMIMKLLVMLLLVTGMGILGNPVSVSAKSVPKLNVTKKTVTEGQSLKLKVKNGSKKITWKTSNKKVATVKKSGAYTATVKARKTGKVTITAKVGKKSLKCKLIVRKKSKGDPIWLLGDELDIKSGHSTNLDVKYLQGREPRSSLWPFTETVFSCNSKAITVKITSVKSSNPSVVSVKKTAPCKMEFTYHKTGKTTISAVSKGKKYKWTIRVVDSDQPYKIKRQQIYQQLGITDNMKDQYKCWLIAKWICDNVTYDYDELKNRKGYGYSYDDALDRGKAVCGGYSELFFYLMQGLHIPCEYISSEEANHAWNQVQIDGKWYNIDVTWMDVGKKYNMKYFLVSDKIFNNCTLDRTGYNAKKHKTDSRFDNCYYLYRCRCNHKSVEEKMNTDICDKEHDASLVATASREEFDLYCPWGNGEWVNY